MIDYWKLGTVKAMPAPVQIYFDCHISDYQRFFTVSMLFEVE